MTTNILILCTGNSARSILAEVLLRDLGAGEVTAHSAGSHPRGSVHPGALAALTARGRDIEGLRSKSWDEFAGPDAPPMDLVITVCASAAGETCPLWPGAPHRAHWGLDDPANAGEDPSDPAVTAAFDAAYATLERRVAAWLALPDRFDADALAAIGKL